MIETVRERMREWDAEISVQANQFDIEIGVYSKDHENTQMVIDSMVAMPANPPWIEVGC